MTSDTPAKRGRKPKQPTMATFKIGDFTASYEDGYYILRTGKSLMLRTNCEENFQEYCRLIEARL